MFLVPYFLVLFPGGQKFETKTVTVRGAIGSIQMRELKLNCNVSWSRSIIDTMVRETKASDYNLELLQFNIQYNSITCSPIKCHQPLRLIFQKLWTIIHIVICSVGIFLIFVSSCSCRKLYRLIGPAYKSDYYESFGILIFYIKTFVSVYLF